MLEKERIFSHTLEKGGFRKRVDWLISGEDKLDITIDSPDLISYGYVPQGEEYIKEKKRAKSLYYLLESGKINPGVSYRFALSKSERIGEPKNIYEKIKRYVVDINENVILTVEDVLVRDAGTFERAYKWALEENKKHDLFKCFETPRV